jgi:hypothetical protein
MAEIDLTREVIETFSRFERRLFRNNVGAAWAGKWDRQPNGTIIIQHPRRVEFGLATGSGDIIGMRSLEITPEMVGTRVAQFVSIETKTPKGVTTEEQKNWRDMVQFMGGASGIARTIDEAATLLGGKRK